VSRNHYLNVLHTFYPVAYVGNENRNEVSVLKIQLSKHRQITLETVTSIVCQVYPTSDFEALAEVQMGNVMA
jgi:hypothetical protein